AVTVTPAFLGELVAEQARQTPHAVAVEGPGGRLSFEELDERANRLSHWLVGQGAGPETLVGLLLPRSVDGIVARLAVLRAGAAFVPIDPAYPAERIAFMLADAAPILTLTSLPELDGRPADPPGVPVDPDQPAYVIYTSGSTGRPKGVVIT